jgi:hypothetical protein
MWTFVSHGQTNYETDEDGSWNSSSTWLSNNKPPDPLVNGDTIFVKHDITYNVNQRVQGVVIVESGASLTSTNKDMDVGKGSTDEGELINYGAISIRDLEVKPDNGCTPSILFPIIHNYGTITTSEDLHVGNNCGAGTFVNHPGGSVTVSSELHLDNYLCNHDTMYVLSKVKNHGGTIDCCGYIETPELDIDENNGRPGTFNCIDICTADGSNPVINIDGTDYDDLEDAIDNADSDEFAADPDSTLICNYNYGGQFLVLPVSLVYWRAELLEDRVLLSWGTNSEANNHYFTVERSKDSKNWEELEYIPGAGNSLKLTTYSWTDRSPLLGTSFYRLRQTDFDGQSEAFQILVIVRNSTPSFLVSYPNPTNDDLWIEGPCKAEGIRLFDSVGREVTHQVSSQNQGSKTLMDLRQISVGIYTLKCGGESIQILRKD